MKDKELEELEKYQLLKDEIANVWRTRKVIVVPVVIGALGAVSFSFKEYMKRIDVNVGLEDIQKTGSIVGDSKDTKKSTVLVRRKKRETRLGPVVTCCNTLPRTINQAEHLF